MDAMGSRMKSGRMAMRFLADPEFRASLRRSSVPLDSPAVVCEWDTEVGEVMQMLGRAHRTSTPKPDHVIVAFRRDEEMFAIIASDPQIELMRDYISSKEVHETSIIGHVYEALQPRKKWNFEDGLVNTPAPIEPSLVFGNMKFELV